VLTVAGTECARACAAAPGEIFCWRCTPDSHGSVIRWQNFGSSLTREPAADAERKEAKTAAIFNGQQAKGPPMKDVEEKEYVYWWSRDFIPSSEVAAFDMDHTIIRPRSGCLHPRDENDWMLMNPGPELRSKLKGLVAAGKCIMLVSNQSALNKTDKAARMKSLENKLARVQVALGVPLAFYAGYGQVSRCRKPAPGLWEQITHDFTQKMVVVDKEKSFYCGDAAGRPEGTKQWAKTTKKDFADTDRRFAMNAGVQFFTPEEYFLGADPLALDSQVCPGLDPSLVEYTKGCAYKSVREFSQRALQTEMVVLVGSPGSGKSSLAKAVFAGYECVNQDTLKTLEKCREFALKGTRSLNLIKSTNHHKIHACQHTRRNDHSLYVSVLPCAAGS